MKIGQKIRFFLCAVIVMSLLGMAHAREVSPSSQEAKEIFKNAQLLLSLKKYDEALVELKKLLVIEPEFEEVYFYLGEASFGAGSVKRAIYWYKESVHYSPNNSIAWRQLGRAYERVGSLIEAAKSYHICLQIDPRDIEAKYALELVKKSLSEKLSKKQQKQKKEEQPSGGIRSLSNHYFMLRHDSNAWRLVAKDERLDQSKVFLQFKSQTSRSGKRAPMVVKILAERLVGAQISNAQYADAIGKSQRGAGYYTIYREEGFGGYGAVKDTFSLKHEGELVKGVGMFFTKAGIGFYLVTMGPTEKFIDVKSAFEEFLRNLTIKF